ncbi:hypothetical protein CN689_26425 [Peribacillus butanolivorans]|uniref:Transposase n=1 Tax=Peribacillus butanolivorans TaxID=421767 RepID=A0AAX0RUM4_9BACI|nr:hypothetical protein [Peribacillus butanolivorans]PEJ25048.1 hypothetical protein CN689_26425 [Peribacillus butanolivorans]
MEQDHPLFKEASPFYARIKTFRTAKQIICGVEVLHMCKQDNFNKGGSLSKAEIEFIHKLFGVT